MREEIILGKNKNNKGNDIFFACDLRNEEENRRFD